MNELDIYRQALEDYLHPSLDIDLTIWGFCFYFSHAHNINVYNSDQFEKRFPVLYTLKPELGLLLMWFPIGDSAPRIELLKQAIKILEE